MAHSARRRADVHESSQSSDTPSNRSTTEGQQSLLHPAAPSVSSFQNAQIGGNVVNSRVYTAGRDLIVNDNDRVSTTLLHHVASGAIFDSNERYSAGRCHPGTRQRMIDQVKEWIQGTSPDSKCILWMYGPAGAGKSSIMQSICEFLRDSDSETNRASFFFARGNTDRGKGTKLFPTLAYQLAVQLPSVRTEINDALHRDSTLPTKSMDIQLRSLIIDPLRCCKTSPSRPPILFIDGLDECGVDDNQGADIQCQIITLISQSLAEDKAPIRFVLASRPEYWIRDSFETSPLSDITLRLSLRDDFDADRDIRTYLAENFKQIHLKKSRIMGSVELPWPPTRIIDRIVEEASGQYICASTVLKFVGDHPFKNPLEQLRIITTAGPHRATAYSELDRLYATVVSVYPEWETMKRVLGGLLLKLNLIAIQVLLKVPRAEITLVLESLSSLIDVVLPAPLSEDHQLLIPIFGSSFADEQISFYHLSFREFLLEEMRSGSYHIAVNDICTEVISAFFGIIWRNLDENYEIEPHVSCNVGLSEYRRTMGSSIQVADFHSYDFRNLFPVLNTMMEIFRHFNPGRRMNHPACFIQDMDFLFHYLKRTESLIHTTEVARHNTDALDEFASMESFLAITKQLQNIAKIAGKIGIHHLSICDGPGFSVTRTLFLIRYLTSSIWDLRVHLWELLTEFGCTVDDCLPTLQRHRHIINLLDDNQYLHSMKAITQPRSSVLMFVFDLEPNLDDTGFYWPFFWINYGAVVDLKATMDEGWLCRTEWANQRISLVSDCLKSILNHLDNDWEYVYVTPIQIETVSAKKILLRDFFNNGDISDIHAEDYFENEYHLSLIEVMVDSEAWTRLFPSRPKLCTHLETTIVPVLCWFNRQLTNQRTSKLIEDYDSSLLPKLTMTMNTIFQKCFVPNFTTPYFSEPVIRSDERVINIEVSSPPSYILENNDSSPVEDHKGEIVRRVQDEIFAYVGIEWAIIPHSEWYPYFAAYLLNILLKNLYCRAYPRFRGNGHDDIFQKAFPCIVQCLPYAQTTSQNLDTLRAIKHLSTQLDAQFPSQGLWHSQIYTHHPGFVPKRKSF